MKKDKYIKEIGNLTKMFGEEFSQRVVESFKEQQKEDFKNSKIPYTVKELLSLNVGDKVWVKYWDEGGKLRMNNLQVVTIVDTTERYISVSDNSESMFGDDFYFERLSDDFVFENYYDGCGWKQSIYKLK
jgi:hypothetical protein